MNKRIRKGDHVLVIAGNDKGRMGKVLRRDGERVVVQGVNIRKRHLKRSSEAQTSSIVEMEKAIHISNICFCNENGDKIHVKSRETDRGKELFFIQDEKEVILRSLRKVK